mmetsp:Transcript_23454/g.36691  ORF Transcript_23454/g.36691 Transcript_23454/m.36691 type:complete len:168 (-) Transcript_23454:125-628(-)|eukprot:CAMPEP_0184312748 /NCGR_PEP_ID=MMETSP1049-20130417/53225_1 /TAXON_ID=77928 /ORGANISM="Proteomonas sulcata, Strain CCMP704" /LENGTH=167 /DNA_ID=CAMNT_0026629199 /DNA_START=58 /DNA_END=561 /DNA_ORIENTATION=+
MANEQVRAVRAALALPLCAAALLLAIVALSGPTSSDEGDYFAILAEVKAETGKGTDAKQTAGLQKLERIRVMACAKKITGSDKPRKLEPKVLQEVNECAKNYMPPVETKKLLKQAAEKLMGSALTKAQQSDAKKLISKTEGSDKAQNKVHKASAKAPETKKALASKK